MLAFDAFDLIHDSVSGLFNHENSSSTESEYLNKFIEEFEGTEFDPSTQAAGVIDEMTDVPHFHNVVLSLFNDEMLPHDQLSAHLKIIYQREDGLKLCFIDSLTIDPEPTGDEFFDFIDDMPEFDIDESDLKRLCVVDDKQLFKHNILADFTTKGKVEVSLIKNGSNQISYHYWNE